MELKREEKTKQREIKNGAPLKGEEKDRKVQGKIWAENICCVYQLDIHISRHLAHVQIKSLNDLFRPTKSRLTYLFQLWFICSQPEMTTITSLLLTSCNRKVCQTILTSFWVLRAPKSWSNYFKKNKKGWKRLKKVVQPAFGCAQHPKAGRNTQQR